MDTVFITIHGGKKCCNCKWLNDGNYGQEDWYTDICSDYAIVAIDRCGHVAGIWKFDKPYHKSICSCGTWVARKYRKRGLAKKLWEVGIQHIKPTRLKVYVASDRGHTLACSMRELFPDIKWNIVDQGGRKLRNLKEVCK